MHASECAIKRCYTWAIPRVAYACVRARAYECVHARARSRLCSCVRVHQCCERVRAGARKSVQRASWQSASAPQFVVLCTVFRQQRLHSTSLLRTTYSALGSHPLRARLQKAHL
eukprot:6197691-Pleurochrysis_carterae.AAC.1